MMLLSIINIFSTFILNFFFRYILIQGSLAVNIRDFPFHLVLSSIISILVRCLFFPFFFTDLSIPKGSSSHSNALPRVVCDTQLITAIKKNPPKRGFYIPFSHAVSVCVYKTPATHIFLHTMGATYIPNTSIHTPNDTLFCTPFPYYYIEDIALFLLHKTVQIVDHNILYISNKNKNKKKRNVYSPLSKIIVRKKKMINRGFIARPRCGE